MTDDERSRILQEIKRNMATRVQAREQAIASAIESLCEHLQRCPECERTEPCDEVRCPLQDIVYS